MKIQHLSHLWSHFNRACLSPFSLIFGRGIEVWWARSGLVHAQVNFAQLYRILSRWLQHWSPYEQHAGFFEHVTDIVYISIKSLFSSNFETSATDMGTLGLGTIWSIKYCYGYFQRTTRITPPSELVITSYCLVLTSAEYPWLLDDMYKPELSHSPNHCPWSCEPIQWCTCPPCISGYFQRRAPAGKNQNNTPHVITSTCKRAFFWTKK
jgi:hypothetical protein